MITLEGHPKCLKCYSEAWDDGYSACREYTDPKIKRLEEEIKSTRTTLGQALTDLANKARQEKNYHTSDAIREILRSQGMEIRNEQLIDTLKNAR